MKKTIRKYKIVFPILVLSYLNFYFLSPFIHEHPLELAGQVETENTLHSHLKSINNLNSNGVDYLSNNVTSHTHDYSFDKPIIIQFSKQFTQFFVYSFICSNDEYYNALGMKFNLKHVPKINKQELWQKYVHFTTDNSPPQNLI